MRMDVEIKATLVSVGCADIDEGLLKKTTTTTPTAGPGAGGESIFFRSGGHRVRLSINRNSPLKLIKDGEDEVILRDGVEIVRGDIEDAPTHCPEQAYITISERCIYDCKFCPVPKLRGGVKSLDTILELVEAAYNTGKMRGIAITSGVAESPEDEVIKTVEVVKALRRRYDLPLGVSVYPTEGSSEMLKEAGATEIKYNVETMDPDIFERACPGLSLTFILRSLEKAVKIFGRNHVSTNFIIGLGESDESVRGGVIRLAGMGVIPVLRPISPHPLRRDIEVERPDPARLLRLARMTKDILERYGLRADLAKTMCLRCTGCDITPHRDV